MYGTSLSAPMFAGVVAIARSKNPGAVGPGSLYPLAGNAVSYSSNYNDIQLYYQNNAGTDPYKVLQGWDFVTGLGSPKVANLVGPHGL